MKIQELSEDCAKTMHAQTGTESKITLYVLRTYGHKHRTNMLALCFSFSPFGFGTGLHDMVGHVLLPHSEIMVKLHA